jgi:eukaryotic-like serine/threonine-protein kinase
MLATGNESVKSPRLTSPDAARRLLAALSDGSWQSDSEPGLPKIEGYVLVRRVGEGGGGEVYQAVRPGSDRLLAIKLIRADDRSEAATQRAWRELGVLSEIRSAYIPRVHDYGVSDRRLYIVTDFIEGLPLEAHCDVQNLGLHDRVGLLARLAEVVQTELHQHGVIHRDLKPDNVLIDAYGQPVVIDLGIAQILDEQSATESITGAPVGTPAYMAPEQARGDRRQISTRTDVYALGATAMRILTGRGPHPADLPLHELIRRIAQDPGAHPASTNALPKPLAAVLGKALAFEPAQRYGSVGELAQDLRRWLGGELVLATPPTLWHRLNSWRRRHRGAFYSGLAACCAVVAGASLWWAATQTRLRTDAEHLSGQSLQLSDEAFREAEKMKAEYRGLKAEVEELRATLVEFVDATEDSLKDGNYPLASELFHAMSHMQTRRILPEHIAPIVSGRRHEYAMDLLRMIFPGFDLSRVEDALRVVESEKTKSDVLPKP